MTVIDRFLKLVSYPTTSDERSETCPSTPRQLALAEELVRQMQDMGIADAHVDADGYVYGTIPANCEKDIPVYGLIAHMDTAPDAPGENIRARVTEAYDGGDVVLNEEKHIVLSPEEYPQLKNAVGKRLIVTDGTTLLGADDKAGVAEIVTACEYLLAHPEVPHRAIAVCFTPDEEVGKGADHFDPEKFPAQVAYTVDGGELGEIEYENFNAAAVTLTVEGVNIHPGSAKNKMKNAILLANQFISLLPAAEAPAHTEGYEGFYHVTDLAGNESQVVLHAIIRDHDLEKFNARKAFVERLVDYLNARWGQGTFRLEMRDSYYNMKEKIRPHMELIENAKAAMEAVGVEPVIVPIRGGTDGARLSWERDIPCPNLCTGGANFHGVHEFIPVPSMEKMVQVLVELVKA